MKHNILLFVGLSCLVVGLGGGIYGLVGSFNAYDRLSDKLPPGASHVCYMDGDGMNSAVTFDLHGRTFMMWYTKRDGSHVVEITKVGK